MIAFFHHRGWHYLLLVALAGLLFFANLGGATLWDVDEGRNSECAYEMMQADNWIVPTFNGQLRVDKPALLYWLQIFAYSLFGVNEFAARLPSALAALLTVLVVYELTRAMFTRTTGLLAGVVVAATPMLCGAARFANPDALLNLFSVLTLAAFWLGLERRRWWWFPLLGVLSGLAVLAKGPVGVILPTAVNFLFLVWERRLGILWDRRWLLTCVAFTFTALPWYVWVGLETHGEFLSGFLFRHNLARGMAPLENHEGFPGFYGLVLLVGAAPWSIFIFVALWFGFWSSLRRPWLIVQSWWANCSEVGAEEAESSLSDRPAAYRMLLCWIVVYVLFFSVAATKLPNYVLPAVAPCAILIARVIRRWQTGSIQLPTWFQVGLVSALCMIGVGVAAALMVLAQGSDWGVIPARHLPGLEFFASVGLIPVVAAGVGAWFLIQRRQSGFVLALTVAAILMLAPLAAFGSTLFNRYKAPRSLVDQAEALRLDRDMRIASFRMDHLPSLNFYVQRDVELLADDRDVVRVLGYSLPVFVFLPADDWERIAPYAGTGRVVGRQYDFYHDADFVVVANR